MKVETVTKSKTDEEASKNIVIGSALLLVNVLHLRGIHLRSDFISVYRFLHNNYNRVCTGSTNYKTKNPNEFDCYIALHTHIHKHYIPLGLLTTFVVFLPEAQAYSYSRLADSSLSVRKHACKRI